MSFLLGGQDPDRLSSQQRRHLRLTHSVILTFFGVGSLYVLDYLLRGFWGAAGAILAVMVVLLLGLLDIRQTGRTHRAAHAATGAIFLALLGVGIGIGNTATLGVWVVLIPLLSGALLGVWAAVGWGLVALIGLWLTALTATDPLQTPSFFHHIHLTGLTLTASLLMIWAIREHELVEEKLRASQAELRALAGQLIRADERTRNTLVTSLHEGVLQETFALRLALTASDDPGSDRLDLLAQLNRIDTQLRSLAVSLRPEIPDGASLADALRQLVADAPKHLGITISLTCPPLPSLPDSTEKALFLSIRELLFNAARHARVDTVSLKLTTPEARLVVEIQDRGVGFVPSARSADGSGLGLRMCQERIAGEGGQMQVDSEPGRGTLITLTLPRPPPSLYD